MAFTLNRRQLFHLTLLLLLLLLLYLAFLVVKPYATSIIFSFILAYMLFPIYKRVLKRVKRKELASTIMIILSLILVILPTFFIITSLVRQSVGAYNSVVGLDLEALDGPITELLARAGLNHEVLLQSIAQSGRNYFLGVAPNLFGTIADLALGLFVMFFLMFYAFIHGERWYQNIKESVPLAPHVKERLFSRMKAVTGAVMYGQLLTSLIQGALGGFMFAIFGIDNPVFWGFIMMILSFIPLLGTPIVWVPAAIFQLFQHNYISGIGILLVGGIVVTNIDNVLRPRLIGGRAHLSTPLVLLGVLGGLSLFGFMGLVLGPLILAMLITVLNFFHKDQKNQKQLV